MQDPKANKQSLLNVSVDKDELVKGNVAHAAAAVMHVDNNDDDDDDDDDSDERGKPDITRNLKVELGVASEQTSDLERKEVRWFIPRKGEGAVGLYPGQAPVQLMITKPERNYKDLTAYTSDTDSTV